MTDRADASRKPPRLRAGDTVAVVAPASSWENRSETLHGVAGLEAWGLKGKLGDHVNDRHRYMAGHDEDDFSKESFRRAMFDVGGGQSAACWLAEGGRALPVLLPRRSPSDPTANVERS